MLKCFILIISFACCNCEVILSPLSVANPYDLLATQLPQHKIELLRSSSKEKFDPLQLIFGLNNTAASSIDHCATSLIQFGKDVGSREEYAIQMLDAWAKPESGIKEGNLRWLGRYYECLRSQTPKFNPKYCTTFVGNQSDPALFGLGIQPGVTVAGCYPDTCSSLNISSLYYPIAEKANVSLVYTTCPVSESAWDTKDIFGLLVFLLLVCLVIASTLYDYIHTRRSEKLGPELNVNGFTHPPPPYSQFNNETTYKLLSSFSLISNTKKLLSTEQRASDIHCLHGMRFISMCWVILGHSFLFPVSFSNNLLFMARYYIGHWEFQAVGNATFSVDTFFFLSGLLVAYLGLRQLTRRDGAMNVPLMYLFRYLRLTPPYALLIFLSVSLWPKMGSGPMWSTMADHQQQSCGKYWFSNLLYFNNLYPAVMGDECYAWGWYLANDTQFYLLAPLFLYLLYRFPSVGLAVTSLVAMASVTVTGIFSSLTKQQPQAAGLGLVAKKSLAPLLTTNTSGLLRDEPQYSVYLSDLYTKPWCRIGAYLVGMITGYVIHNYNNKIRMPKVVAFLGWVVFGTTACAILYGLYPSFSDLSTPIYADMLDNKTAAFYNAVSRPLWTVCLAWVVIACTNGYGGPINALLSWKVFIPLSRLTYCTYLVHPLVIWWLVATAETLFHYSIQLMIMIFAGTLLLSTLLAYVIAMVIEFPVASLMKIWQSREERPPMTTNIIDRAPLVGEADA